MENRDPNLVRIWRQKTIPVVGRKGKEKPLLVKLPYSEDRFEWLRNGRRTKPEWLNIYKCWKTPSSWFEDSVKRCLERYERVYVIQPYREQQKCAPACWNATGVKCECSCMGENHGSGNPAGKWHVVSETFAVHWGERKYACRLLKPTNYLYG
jgi:hypothetical protein